MENENITSNEIEGELLPDQEREYEICMEGERGSHLKSHSMVFSGLDLTQKMHDLMALMFYRMSAKDWEREGAWPEYTWNSDELSEWFGIPKNQLSSALKNPAEKLVEKKASIEKENDWDHFSLFKHVGYRKGQLIMVPNELLREHYLIKVSEDGFAKIDNKIFLALSNPNSKRIFEFMSRFKGQYDMFAMSVERIQIYLGIKSPRGKILKPSYASERRFIKRVIEPSLKEIANCPATKGKIEVIEKDGLLGYELTPMRNGNFKIKFNIRWLAGVVDKDKRKDVLASVDKELLLYKEVVERNGDGLPHLKKVRRLLKSIHESTEQIDRKIDQIVAERKKHELNQEEKELQELESKVLSSLENL